MGSWGFLRIAAAGACLLTGAEVDAQTVSVVLPTSAATPPIDGRLVLIVSPTADPEPRLQVALEAPLRSPFMFGRNVDALQPGARVVMDDGAYGWPVQHISALPPGEYTVQAVLNRYEIFHRADSGSTRRTAAGHGRGPAQWNRKPGNLYSKPMSLHVGPWRSGQGAEFWTRRSRRSRPAREPLL